VYGALELRLSEDGRYMFLKINPAGQLLYVEQATRQPITADAPCVSRPSELSRVRRHRLRCADLLRPWV
jgi:hypothetical protein